MVEKVKAWNRGFVEPMIFFFFFFLTVAHMGPDPIILFPNIFSC